nr:odorant receptor 46a-like [Leptinotarsa decemlineata]
MLLTLTEAFAKYAVLRMNQQKIQTVREKLLDEQYHYQSCGSFQPGKMFNDSKSFCRRIVITTFSVYYVVVVTASTSVLVKLNKESEKIYFQGNITCHDFLPYSFVIPFPTPTVASCKYALVFMDAGSCILGSFLASYDTTFTSILICVKTKLQILSEAFKTIRVRALAKLNLPPKSQLEAVDSQLEEILYEEIKHCAKHLDSLLRVCAETENIFKYVTLLQMLDSLLVMASCLFVASLITQSDPDFFAMAQYMLSVLTQLLMICYFGNEITEVSSTLSSSLYQNNWIDCSKRFKQCMIIMMCRMQKKLSMTIGKFSPLTLNTFLSVVKGSFSYCAVFQQVNK